MPQSFAHFKEHFTASLAATEAKREVVYRLRYQVYCEEFAYYPAQNYPNQQETDAFDAYSRHCLISYNQEPAACARLVMPTTSEQLLPFENRCANSLDVNLLSQLNLDRQKIAEISRVAVAKGVRRRKGEVASRFGDVLDFPEIDSRTGSLPIVAVFLAATALAENSGRSHLFMLLEPFVVKILDKHNIAFQQVGAENNYQGIRAPYLTTTNAILDTLDADTLDLYNWLKEQIFNSGQNRTEA